MIADPFIVPPPIVNDSRPIYFLFIFFQSLLSSIVEVAMPYPRWTVAVHEASHAIVGRIFNKPVRLISVVSRGESLGRTVIGKLDDWTELERKDEFGTDTVIRGKIVNRRRRTIAILVAGDTGNHIEAASPLLSQRLPAHVLDDLLHHRRTSSAALHELSDLKRAFDLALHDPEGETMEVMEEAERRTSRFLKSRWADVERLAWKLCKRRTIYGLR
jgi:hypothetical protein